MFLGGTDLAVVNKQLTSIRPFGSAIFDGVDLDIENVGSYYPDFVAQLTGAQAKNLLHYVLPSCHPAFVPACMQPQP